MFSLFKYTSLMLVSAILVGCGGGGGGSTPVTEPIQSEVSTDTTGTTTTTNDPLLPTAFSKTVTIVEDSIANILLESDVNTEVSYTISTPPSYGTLVGTPPNMIYVPEGDFNGTDSFSFTVTDPEGTSAPATIEIIVTDAAEPATNIAPTAVDYNVTLDEDSNASAPMVAVDPNADVLTYKITNGPFNGTYDPATHIYTPNANFNGTDSFKYTANDGSVDSNEAKIVFTVVAVNDAPTVTDINITTDEDSTKTITLKGNDIEGDPLQYRIVTSPQHGTYDLNTQTYTPDSNFFGTDSFTYIVNDGTEDSSEATVSITINPINDIPVASDIALSTSEDIPVSVTLNGTDSDGDTLTYRMISGPANGTFDGTDYTPNINFNGTDSFTYVANDGTVDSSEATVTITVLPVNDAPVIQNQNISLDEDTNAAIVLSGTDADGDQLTFSYTQPTYGSFDGNTYTPNTNFNGPDSFTYIANDGTEDSAAATVYITVNAVNDAPVAEDQNLSTAINTALDIVLTGSDVDIEDTLSYTVIQTPANGTLSGTAPNLTYTPNQDYTGTDSFTFSVNDGTTDSNTATVTLTVGNNTVNITGNITYDYVPGVSTGGGGYKLDYTQTVQKPVRYAVVDLIDASGNLLDTTTTDANGDYSFSAIAENTDVKIRVSAKMLQTGTPAWDVKVVDNTNNDALYVMEGALASVGTSDQIRDLNAPSGWDGNSYASERTAAPFAILDDIYATVQTILSADPQAVFDPLQVNWSVNNVATWGDKTLGEIGTSHYTGGNLFILGDADSDTDEYDNHVITHEWGHYYEDKFSRSDSIGGSHSDGDILDIRVAFGEGWGNAFSAISLNDPVYFDTYGTSQASGWSMDMDNMTQNNPGWFSESSVQRIIYDIWDNNNEAENNDALSLGFGPIHQVMTGSEKNVAAFTSIFTFIKSLKDENSGVISAIDDIVSNENIATIDDIFGGLNGTARTNRAGEYPYAQTSVNGTAAQVATGTSNGTYNKLGNRTYVTFSVSSNGTYHIAVQQTNGSDSDPDFYLFRLSPFGYITRSIGSVQGLEEGDFTLDAGDYILDISEYNEIADAQFDVTVTQ